MVMLRGRRGAGGSGLGMAGNAPSGLRKGRGEQGGRGGVRERGYGDTVRHVSWEGWHMTQLRGGGGLLPLLLPGRGGGRSEGGEALGEGGALHSSLAGVLQEAGDGTQEHPHTHAPMWVTHVPTHAPVWVIHAPMWVTHSLMRPCGSLMHPCGAHVGHSQS